MENDLWRIHSFDIEAEFDIVERRLPHWMQSGAVAYLTFRTWDSVPQALIRRWYGERDRWLEMHGINRKAADWRLTLAQLGRQAEIEFLREFSTRWNAYLDRGYGECPFKRSELRQFVVDCLAYRDGAGYRLTDYVLMPNHLHILAAFRDGDQMLAQCRVWKHYTATQINRNLGRQGRFWQQDGFDHLVRSDREFMWYREYIRRNPVVAGIRSDEFAWYSCPLDALK